MWRTDSLENTQMLGRIEGWRRGWQDEVVELHHWLNGHEFEQALGVGDGQGSLAWCSPWGLKELDMTERLKWIELSKDQCVHSQLYSTLGDPLDCSLPVSSVPGIFQARIWEWVTIFGGSRGSSWSRGRTRISCVPCIGRQIPYQWAAWGRSV